jgi:membrane protein YqaA with SNARE-associated domain
VESGRRTPEYLASVSSDLEPPQDSDAAMVAPPAEPPTEVPRRSIPVRLLAAAHRIAEAGWSTTAVGGWSFLQGSAVPGPVDSFIIPLALADPPRAWRFAIAATIGSLTGALLAYGVGYFAFDSIGLPLLTLVGVTAEDLEKVRGMFRERGWVIVLLSTVTPLSGKLVSVVGGSFGIPFHQFAIIMGVGRAVRFFTVAAVCRLAGDRVERWVERRYGKTLHELATSQGATAGRARRADS